MNSSRHPHPHIDPRQPRHGSRPATNPPVFAWKPPESARCFSLHVARNAAMTDIVLEIEDLSDPLHLPEVALPSGRYWWTWSSVNEGGETMEGEVFGFEIRADAVTLEVPPAEEWLRRFPEGHPRLYLRPEDVADLRDAYHAGRKAGGSELKAAADALLDASHEMAEPPFLPDRRDDYEAYFTTWYATMMDSRRFVREAETLALAWLASGEERYARAACLRMASISRWDPYGSSHLEHNDEAHMSFLWDGIKVIDWVWDQFTETERELVIRQYAARGRITYEHMHDRGSYGVTRFDSHAGREIVFLAELAIVFHEHIPEARNWLRWLRPVLCGIWPIWSGDDGGWAEGLSYATAYVGIMQMFATALKRGTGVDLYRRPFWKGHARWRRACWPFYAQWLGFGDHTECWRGTWRKNANIVETIAHETDSPELLGYVADLRRWADQLPDRMPDTPQTVDSLSFLTPDDLPEAAAGEDNAVLSVFPGAGWAAFRTAPDDEERDVALLFRSSPYGSISHSHADQNDFILHVAGQAMAMPSGYYDGYGSNHHIQWVWHTRSHNCVTLSDAGQWMRSYDARGAIVHPYEDQRAAYLCGVADGCYGDRAQRCRRHVLLLKKHSAFLIVDEFEARPRIVSSLQWNMHSWATFDVEESLRTFRMQRDGSAVEGYFLYHHNAFFTLTSGWDPPMMDTRSCDQWLPQHHLRYTVSGLLPRVRLGVLLVPSHALLASPEVRTERSGHAELAHVGSDLLLVNQADEMEYDGVASRAIIRATLDGATYEIDDAGIRTR